MDSDNNMERLREMLHQCGTAADGDIGGLDVFVDQLAAIKNNQGTPPPPVLAAVLPPPFASRLLFRMGLENNRPTEKKTVVTMKTTVRPPMEHGVAPATMETLRPIDLKEIATKVNYIHTGRVLFARIVDDPYRIIGTNVLIEDEGGNYVQAGIYNYLLASEDPLDFFSNGQYLAFLEPYMRHSQDNPNAPLLLRCDNPQCVRRFTSYLAWRAGQQQSQPPGLPATGYARSTTIATITTSSPSALRQQGNQLFERGKLDQARSVYTEALSVAAISDDDKMACWSNRAEIHLRLEQWEDAAADARSALSIDPNHVKARYRIAKALLRLNQIEQGRQIIATLAKEGVIQEVKSMQAEANRLLLESQEGQYDLAAMRRSSTSTVFHADFVAKAVKIGVLVERPTIMGKKSYRGCVAIEALAEGALLTASKAFAIVPEEETDDKSSSALQLQFQLSTHSGLLSAGSSLTLANEIVVLLHRRPQLVKRLYQLSDGEDNCPPHDGPVVHNDSVMIDLEKIRNIQNANSFGVYAGNPRLNFDWLCIQKENQLGRLLTEKEGKANDSGGGSGIWLTESFFNHSCNPNCSWSQINDHMFIRSIRPIAAQEELTISYTDPEMSFAEKSAIFARWIRPNVGFTCACDYCALLRLDRKQREMEAEVDTAYKKAAKLVSSLKGIKMAQAAEKVMPERRRLDILSAHAALPPALCHRSVERVEIMQGTVLQRRGQLIEAYQCYERASAIEYAITGASYQYAKSLWRLVGSALSCGRQLDALQHLHRIKTLPCFEELFVVPKRHLASSEGEKAFIYLTERYAMPWWQDDYVVEFKDTLQRLACQVWRDRR